MQVADVIQTFFSCFQSSQPCLLDDICEPSCKLNNEELHRFIEKRKQWFQSGIYEQFTEHETERISFKQLNNQVIYMCRFESTGKKDGVPFTSSGEKTFQLQLHTQSRLYKIVNVHYNSTVGSDVGC